MLPWQVSPDRGFLMNPDPITDLSDMSATLAEIEGVASEIPELLQSGRMRERLEQMPMLDVSEAARGASQKPLATEKPSPLKGLKSGAQVPVVEVEQDERSSLDFRVIERLWVLYTYFANAYVFADPEKPGHHITKSVAVPLHRLAQIVERPPIFSYVSLVLNNWRRIDPNGPIDLDNTAALQHFVGCPDEHWFGLVHVNVEFCAAGAVRGIEAAIQGAGDARAVEQGLNAITDGLRAMLRAFGRMTHGCDPDVYHTCVRPYMFGFENVVYEGVAEYGGQPQSFRGGSGAQSSVIPAIVAALGIQHEQTGLMKHLDVMKAHMPKAHREFISRVTTSAVRDFVRQANDGALTDAYNGCVREMMTFRKAHFHYARIYIFDKVDNPVGTGGTLFMDWLSRLIAETEAHLL